MKLSSIVEENDIQYNTIQFYLMSKARGVVAQSPEPGAHV